MKKNRGKILSTIILFIIIVLPVITANSCNSSIESEKQLKEEESQYPTSNNYQGLRTETKNINLEELVDNYPRIVCFGDSVTFGWNVDYKDSYPSVLEELLQKDYSNVKVINSGIGGDTVIDAYNRLESDVISFEPHLVIINLGLNDGWIQEVVEDGNGGEVEEPSDNENKEIGLNTNVDLETFKKYYCDIIEIIELADIKIILMGINPVLGDPSLVNDNIAGGQIEIYKMYNEQVREIGLDSNLVYLDLWSIFNQDYKAHDYLQNDGIHPDENGLKLIAKSIYDALKICDF